MNTDCYYFDCKANALHINQLRLSMSSSKNMYEKSARLGCQESLPSLPQLLTGTHNDKQVGGQADGHGCAGLEQRTSHNKWK